MNIDLYGKYRDVRNSVWQVIIDYEIDRLPINLTDITKKANIKVIKNSEADMLEEGIEALTILDDDEFYIVYNDSMSIHRKRFTIAHELGHIFLGHFMDTKNNIKSFVNSSLNSEADANNFAIRLLAPACVLWGINISSAEELSYICNISLSTSTIRYNRLLKLYERNMFLTSFLERRVFEQFKDFINSYNLKNRY